MIASNTPSTATTLAFVIVVTGGVVSRTTVQRHSAGEASARSAMSTARTRRMCSPAARPEKTPSLGQLVNTTAPSSAHSNVACGSLLSNAKVAIDSPVSGSTVVSFAGGPKTIDVSGATLSTTVHSQVVTSASLPASSDTYTRTAKSCGPSGTPMYVFGEVQSENAAPSKEHS